MARKLAAIPELCSGCRICELTCAIEHFGVNNPKKSAVRVLVTYPHPVMRLPIVCTQCKRPLCADACPVGALRWTESVVQLDRANCISCMKCVETCPKGALRFIPEQSLGESKRMNNILSYTHMKEIEFTEKGEQKTIRYAEIGQEEL